MPTRWPQPVPAFGESQGPFGVGVGFLQFNSVDLDFESRFHGKTKLTTLLHFFRILDLE